MPALRQPDRKMSSAPRCDRPVQGDGIMSYHCSLPQGHTTEPPEDPEPCYAVESARTARAWSAWAERQEARASQPRQQYIDCPACKVGAMQVHSETREAICGNCGEHAEFQPEAATDPATLDQIIGDTPPEFVSRRQAELEGEAEGRRLAEEAIAEEGPTAPTFFVDLDTAVPGPEGWQVAQATASDGCVGEHTPATNPDCEMRPTLGEQDISVLRTRPEDQRLPDGDESIPDDQSLLIADIEERRRVGISRYGQGHRPFNGRNTLQDLYEEQLDLMVYLRSIVRMAEADRETLIREVTRVLKEINRGPAVEMTIKDISGAVVDRIMGWVAAQHLDGGRDLIEQATHWAVPGGYCGSGEESVAMIRVDDLISEKRDETSSTTDWEPLGEDVTMHSMLGHYKHEDQRLCLYHSRLGAWTFEGTKKCLREHP